MEDDDIEEFVADENSDYDSDEDSEVEEMIDPSELNDHWTWQTTEFQPSIHNYIEQARPRIGENNWVQLDYFQHFFDTTFIEKIVNQTNIYQAQNPIGEREKMAPWVDVTLSDIWIFFGVVLLTGLVRKNRIDQYWSVDALISTPIFGQVMSRNRYRDIMRCLHFSDNSQPSDDRLKKIIEMVNFLQKKFRDCIVPYQNLCIDESLLLWKGRLSFKQYIPSKRNRFGLKMFLLVDCTTKVILDVIIYTGSTTRIRIVPDLGISGSIVMTLMSNFLRKGHTLFVDNWYSSPKLFDLLHRYNTNTCGTVRKNRVGLPTLNNRLNRGEIQHSNNGKLLALKWQDKREVFMLSSIHQNTMVNTGRVSRGNQPIRKPQCIIDYNNNMNAVDKVDMQLSFSECIRKTLKWYKKVFFHFLDLSIFNSYAIYCKRKRVKFSLHKYKLEVVRQIFHKYNAVRPVHSVQRPPHSSRPPRLTERHFASIIAEKESSSDRVARRRCRVCSSRQKQSKTMYICESCENGVPLCVPDCFRIYHTVLHFDRDN